jgi:nucleotide-binding universal stress UspA family protein
MFRKILVPLDRSSLAERVLEHLRWLAPAETTELALVSVVEPAHYYPYIYGSGTDTQPERTQARQYVQRYLDGHSARLRKFGYTVSTHVFEGDPAEKILSLANEWRVDLIAMSTHGRSGFTRWALGSVAERIIQGATVPVFLVREHIPVPAAGQERRILVPLDGSELAAQALSYALEVAKSIGASLLLLRVMDLQIGEDLGLYFEDAVAVAETMAKWRDEANTYLEEVAQRVRSSGLVVETRVLVGVPDKVIWEVATDESINLIVMSTHGRSGFRRWVYGSTANKVLRTVSCPLVLVRAVQAKRSEPLLQPEEALNTLSIQTSNSSPSG